MTYNPLSRLARKPVVLPDMVTDNNAISQSSHQNSSPPVNSPPRRARSTLECPICLSLMTDPVVARCGHSFCTPCINAYLGYAEKRRRDDSLRTLARPTTKPCPVCETALGDATVYPNVALATLVDRARAQGPSNVEGHRVPLDVRRLPDDEADRLLTDLLERRRAHAKTRHAIGMDIIIPFLEKCRVEKHNALSDINDDLRLIDNDLVSLRARRDTSAPDHLHTNLRQAHVVPPDIAARCDLVSRYHDNVKTVYFDRRRAYGEEALPGIMDMLVDATSVARVRKRASIQHIDILRSNHNLISSIEFNSTSNLFATAGVTKRIKVFEFNSLIESSISEGSTAHHYPILEIPTTSKLSCLSWSRDKVSVLAVSMYNGDILIHDTETNTQIQSLRGHTKRTWYVDFSTLKPSLLLSGSDDNTVKLWDVDRQGDSAMTLQTSANVCCVKFNPFEPNEFAFGSADHNVYSYDLRHPKTPLCVFEGHWRAVSHVLFLNRSELVSASTDSSCKLWNVEKQEPGLSYAGHTNDRNFVGLCGSKDFFACGSEDNSVYVYHKGFAGPVVRYGFASGGGFVSTVAWKPNSPWIVAASNAGSVEILELL